MGNSSSGNAVAQRVEQAGKTGVCSLKDQKLTESHVARPNLEGSGYARLHPHLLNLRTITQFPGQLLTVKGSLRTLDLSTNKLPHLPTAVGDFSSLRSLNLSHNRLVQLPETVGSLKKLESLNLEQNGLTSLPDSCVNLKSLKTVNLSQNKLQTFPLFLCQLTHLDFANLSSNAIPELPQGIEALNAVELNLNGNSISVLPPGLAKCRRLKVLRVQENTLELMGLPPALLSDSNISLLCAEGNLFDLKELHELPEYEKYMERYSATRRKFD